MNQLHNPVSVRPSRASAEWDRALRARGPARDAGRMIDPSQIAHALADAERERKALPPFTDEHPDLDEVTAYAAQWAGIRAKLAAGERLTGAKLGLTSRIKQQVMKVDSPLYGWVTSGMLLAQGEPVELARFIHPRVEPEIAFLLARDVEPPATVTSVLAATESVFAAVDVLDSRYEDFRFRLPDVIADNASAGAFLLGPKAVPPADLDDLRLLGCVLRVNGDVVATAAGAATMGHPAASVAWLANRLAARPDLGLRAGMLVFSGGLTEPVPLAPGTSVTAELEGLGSIEVYAR
jgi:2-oxo-3-hexenedioate decarboxylase